jgi:HK97 family phage portal protein
MKFFGLELRRAAVEKRASPEDPRVPVSASNFLEFFGVSTKNLPQVTIDSALRVPAVTAAVSFLSRSLATLPLHAYKMTGEGPQKIGGKLGVLVHENPNPDMDRFKCWRYFWQQVFTGGRGLAYIERNGTNPEYIWPIDPSKASIHRRNQRIVYEFEGKVYESGDVIDIAFMQKPNMLDHYGPIMLAEKAIQLALSMNDYASGFFAGGGVPPLALVGPLPQGREAMQRAMGDIHRAIEAAKESSKPIFPMPPGHELKPVGFDPEKGQMTDARSFQVIEIARAYQMPPIFLQDLSNGTYSNTEQQDLFLVKHLIGQWAQALEGELNLKLFGRDNNRRFVEHNLDGLMRGDFVSRMSGMATAIQNGVLTPNEGRALDNRQPKEGGDRLLIQGATVPLAGQHNPQGEDNDEEP